MYAAAQAWQQATATGKVARSASKVQQLTLDACFFVDAVPVLWYSLGHSGCRVGPLFLVSVRQLPAEMPAQRVPTGPARTVAVIAAGGTGYKQTSTCQ